MSATIGVFDSGIGGITVLTELRRKLGGARFVYLGDTAHVPYGAKSPALIQKLSRDCARTLKGRGVDAIVVACGTASSWAMEAVRDEVGKQMPVFGVVEPGVEASLQSLASIGGVAPVLVLATRATVKSGAYGRILRGLLASAADPSSGQPYPVFEQACPLLAPMVEEGWVDHPILHETIAEYVQGYARLKKPGVALLACTHYPWIHAAFEKALPGWRVLNQAQAVSQAVLRSEFWKSRSDSAGRKPPEAAGLQPHVIEWIFTDPDAIPAFAQRQIQQIGAQQS